MMVCSVGDDEDNLINLKFNPVHDYTVSKSSSDTIYINEVQLLEPQITNAVNAWRKHDLILVVQGVD